MSFDIKDKKVVLSGTYGRSTFIVSGVVVSYTPTGGLRFRNIVLHRPHVVVNPGTVMKRVITFDTIKEMICHSPMHQYTNKDTEMVRTIFLSRSTERSNIKMSNGHLLITVNGKSLEEIFGRDYHTWPPDIRYLAFKYTNKIMRTSTNAAEVVKEMKDVSGCGCLFNPDMKNETNEDEDDGPLPPPGPSTAESYLGDMLW